jgi:hypothetical protein
MQKIQIIEFLFENRLHWQFKVEKNFYKWLFLGYKRVGEEGAGIQAMTINFHY